eukprot:TRINITY_DN11790_c1_g1_i1.p1 TRINITY_DN11790_c1_g1~~TRINITY_DN11790_c1_g1_i1.p1  ORF type:complete len:405 (+),score=102.15 TRINITY_DN11790_c1_g1_i1:46-1215(+)
MTTTTTGAAPNTLGSVSVPASTWDASSNPHPSFPCFRSSQTGCSKEEQSGRLSAYSGGVGANSALLQVLSSPGSFEDQHGEQHHLAEKQLPQKKSAQQPDMQQLQLQQKRGQHQQNHRYNQQFQQWQLHSSQDQQYLRTGTASTLCSSHAPGGSSSSIAAGCPSDASSGPQPRQLPPTRSVVQGRWAQDESLQEAGHTLNGRRAVVCAGSSTSSSSRPRSLSADAREAFEVSSSGYAWQLSASLSSTNAGVRQAAVATLGKLGSAAIPFVGRFGSMLLDDVDSTVRCAAAVALGHLGDAAAPHAKALLAASLRDTDEDVRFAAAVALGTLGDAASAETQQLALALRNANASARQAAAELLTSGQHIDSARPEDPLKAWTLHEKMSRQGL